MAARLAPGDYDSCIISSLDDTAMPKKGDRSVNVAPQYASSLGKTANCQPLVSLTLARGEVPVMVGLRLFVPESWTSNPVHLKHAGVPVEHRTSLRGTILARPPSSCAHGHDRLRIPPVPPSRITLDRFDFIASLGQSRVWPLKPRTMSHKASSYDD
jgi:hypothetical protein